MMLGRLSVDDYNLVPGELVILQNDSVELGVGSGAEALEEVVLTSRNLILVANVEEGLFRRRRYLKRCSLDQIAETGDVPQAIATQVKGTSVLRVAFMDETVTLHFLENERRTAEHWAQSVRRAAAGNVDAIDTSELADDADEIIPGASSGAAAAVGAAGSLIGRVVRGPAGDIATLVGAVGNMIAESAPPKQKARSPKEETSTSAEASQKERLKSKASTKCPGCHAPVTGRVGDGVRCPYCDTKFVL